MAEPDVQTAVIEEGESTADAAAPEAARQEPGLVELELLVEDVSIDGMCGVY